MQIKTLLMEKIIFLLTDDNEFYYIKNGKTTFGFTGNTEGTFIEYENLSNKIDGTIMDIFSLQNYADCCYVVDEKNNIYFVKIGLDEVEVTLITRFQDGKIADMKGFTGQNEKILIRTDDGSYYYTYYDEIKKIEAIGSNYKNAVLLADENIVALGNDGCLYLIEN